MELYLLQSAEKMAAIDRRKSLGVNEQQLHIAGPTWPAPGNRIPESGDVSTEEFRTFRTHYVHI